MSTVKYRPINPNDLTSKVCERFTKKLTTNVSDNCQLWSGSTTSNNYGVFYLKGELLLAQRVAWAIANQCDPGNKKVTNSCGNTLCCNPLHLSLCTQERHEQESSTVHIPINPTDLTLRIRKRFTKEVITGRLEECTGWGGYIGDDGYAHFNIKGKSILAHRIAWAIANEQDPGDAKILHSCDNPICCNPNHLSLGTQKDNMKGCVSRGRHGGNYNISDEQNQGRRVISRDQMLEIFERYHYTDDLVADIALDYNIIPSRVCRIARGEAKWLAKLINKDMKYTK